MARYFKFRTAAVVTAGALAFFSCKKSDTDGSKVITEDSVWSTDQEALATVNAAFPPWQRLSSSFSFLLESATEHTISFEGTDDEAGPLVSQFKADANNWYPTKICNYLYVSIGEANRTIAKADSSYTSTTLSQETINLVRGRAKFIRALGYSYLTQLWGEVPLILKTSATQAEQTTRKSID